MEVRYCICKHCGNIVEKVKDKGVPVICCGEPMQELKAGVTDAAVEKHVPVYTVEGSHVHVVVGETKHSMLEAVSYTHLGAAFAYKNIRAGKRKRDTGKSAVESERMAGKRACVLCR